MKRALSLSLLLTLCFSGLLPLCAVPARAQDVASAGNLSRLREQYERLLAIEHDPTTTPEVREVNHTFLEERRAQLVSALRARIGALRKYEEAVSASLGDGERRALADSIRRLAQELERLQPARAQAAPLTPAARPARRPSRATRTAPTVTTPAALAPAAGPRRAETQDPSPAPTPQPAPETPKKDDPITITSPAEGKTVGVSEVELEVALNDEDINDLMVAVYTPASEKPKTARQYEVKRSDRDKKTIAVALSKGDNRIEVSDVKRGEVKATLNLKFQPPVEPPLGRAGTSGGATSPLALTATTERWTNVPESGSDVRVGYVGEAGKSYQFYVRKRSGGAPQNIDSTMTPGISGVVSATFPELSAGDMVGVVQMDGVNPVDGSRDEIAVESALDETRGGPFGLLLGGVVMSQQAQEFQQADPFFGFTAGYVSKMRNAHKLSRKGACGNAAARYIETNVRGLFATEDGLAVRCVRGRWVVSDNRKITEENANARFVRNGGFNGWRWNLRFQGLFQSDPRKATATDPTETGGGGDGGGNGTTDNPFTFIASRKTFNIESQFWVDFWASSALSIGPYVAVGASTVLDKNELQGEAVTDEGEGTEGDSTNTVSTLARSDNDIKKYYEGGALININLNRDLFLQSILAYRHDEALAGLYDGPASCKFCDTQHRFVGKLRIFPSGLSRGFGRQIRMAPMFGVEVNAGRGPDHIKFFSGFAMRIKGININDAGAKLADTPPAEGDGNAP